MDANRKTSKDRGSRAISHSPRKMSTEKVDGNKSDGEGGLFLTNPMACEEDSPGSPRQTAAYVDKPATSKSSKSRPKSPSFLRLLVGSFRSKHGEATEEQHPEALAVPPPVSAPAILHPANSISDNEEPLFPQLDRISDKDRHREIEHLATLPRRPERKKKKKKQQEAFDPTQLQNHVGKDDPLYESIPDKIPQLNGLICEDDSSEQLEYQSKGLEALQTLHSQLQILVDQECEEEIADLLQSNVVCGLQQQLEELQKTLGCLQESDKNLRLALKLAEMKNRETDIKFELSSERCLRLEQRNRRLDHKFRLLLRQHRDLEKHLQKKAILNQMEQTSPGRLRRPQSAKEHTRRASFEHTAKTSTLNALTSPVKRHGSIDGEITTPTGPTSIPRCPSGSMSHTETRV